MKRQLMKVTLIWAIVIGFLVFTQPDKLPLIGLILPFILIYVAIYNTWNLLDMLRRHYFSSGKDNTGKHRRLGIVVSLVAMLLLLLQSLGQLTVRDVVTVLVIFTITYLYFGRNRSTNNKQV